LRGESRARDPAFPDDLFFATVRGASRTGVGRAVNKQPGFRQEDSSLRYLVGDYANRPERRERYRGAFPSLDRAIGILPAARILSVDWIPEGDFSANGLRLPKIRRSR